MADESITRPIYQQIAIDIANRIYNGEFPLGSKIHGRSTLAGQYNVSPETIRRAVILLQDMYILEVYQGSGIVVKSRDEAYKFIEKFKNMDSINSLKNSIANIIQEKRNLDDNLEKYVNNLIDYVERFKNSNPFAPVEIKITEGLNIIGKTIGEVNFWQNTGATIIGIRREEKLILSPGPYAVFMPGDVFIMVGDEGAYERTSKYINEIKKDKEDKKEL
jgi:K+/H+ antiporter YhaU regulatory subunit KhtT